MLVSFNPSVHIVSNGLLLLTWAPGLLDDDGGPPAGPAPSERRLEARAIVRRLQARALDRRLVPAAISRRLEASPTMPFTIPTVSHDPNDIVDYEVNWRATLNPVLEVGETIASSTWAIDGMRVGGDGVLVTSDAVAAVLTGGSPSRDASITGDVTKCWVQGGTPGMQYLLRNRMVTNASPARTFDRSRWLEVEAH